MDKNIAKEMLGKVVLVGITTMNRDDQALSQNQYFGTILRIGEDEGVIILRGDTGEEMWLPPALEYYEAANPGEYHLRSTGQVVVNPDYVVRFNKYLAEQ